MAQIDEESVCIEMDKGVEVFKEAFLKSEEFCEIVGDKALGFLNVNFNGCVDQFQDAGYHLEGNLLYFISVDKVFESLTLTCKGLKFRLYRAQFG